MTCYRGQYESGNAHGYGEYTDDKGKSQGQFVGDKGVHGMIRHTSLDGSVSDTIWELGNSTEIECNADDAVEQAEQGLLPHPVNNHSLTHPAALKAIESGYEARVIAAQIRGEPEPVKPGERDDHIYFITTHLPPSQLASARSYWSSPW